MKVLEKKMLVSKYTALRDQLIKTIDNSGFEIDVDGDVVDKLQGQSLINVQNSISRSNLLKLRAINAALKLIDKGEYGECEECGEPIGVKRLEAIPGVTVCVFCAEKSELRR